MIPLVKVAMPPRETLMPALEAVLYSGMVAEGEHVYNFEKQFGELFGLPNVLATSSGTAALHIAFLLAGVQPGDEVITTSMTAEPTNTTILQVGAVPVFADVDPQTGNLSPQGVEARITGKTKAICVVHYAGYVAQMDALRQLANRHGLQLIEDCAHALGASYAGKPVGTIGDYAIYSFQAIKHLTTVDGGALAMKDPAQMAQARRLRWFGLTKGVARTEVNIVSAGFKYNMNNVTATIGLQQLQGVQQRLQAHRQNGRFLDQALQNIPGLRPAKVEPASDPTYWLYTLLCDDSQAVENCLAASGITASKLHRPNHLHSVFQPLVAPLPQLDKFYTQLLHLPCGWWVSAEDRQHIVAVLRRG